MTSTTRMIPPMAEKTSHFGMVRAGSAGSNTSGLAVSNRLAAHLRAKVVADLGPVEADRAGIALGKADRVGRRRQARPVAGFEILQMAKRNPRLRGDVVERQLLLFTRGAQAVADRRRLDEFFSFSVIGSDPNLPRLSKALP